jgi:16S rRNA (guanine1207-N2)-methyltransferase
MSMNNISPDDSYLSTHRFSTQIFGRDIFYVSKPGLPDWSEVTTPAILLAKAAELSPDDRVFLLGCGHGALAVALAQLLPSGELWLTDNNYISLQMSKLTLLANQVTGPTIIEEPHLPVDKVSFFDKAFIELPKGRRLAQRWLVEAFYALRPGGVLYIAGANNQGIQSTIKDAEALFGQSSLLYYKKGCRVARFRKDLSQEYMPAWFNEPGIAPDTWHELEIIITGKTIGLHTLPGVFAYNKLDGGTQILLENMEVPPQTRVLDVGCGYGVLGLAAALNKADLVDLIDVNLLACACAQNNIALHGINHAQVYPSDALSRVIDKKYDLIITNPPFHSGREVDYQMTFAFIQQSHQVLESGGKLWLVANKFIRYNHYLEQFFRKVEIAYKTGKYYVLVATK